MKLIHISDTHGRFPKLPDGDDIVIHTGDFFPNLTRGDWSVEPRFQEEWIMSNLGTIKDWLRGRTFVRVAGNHDFMDPRKVESFLNGNGVSCVDTTNKLVEVQGTKFYGFPWIPYICGEWNYEKRSQDLWQEMKWARESLESADVILAHCPPSMVLDCGEGNPPGPGRFERSCSSWIRSRRNRRNSFLQQCCFGR